jgi:hypothetical protein
MIDEKCLVSLLLSAKNQACSLDIWIGTNPNTPWVGKGGKEKRNAFIISASWVAALPIRSRKYSPCHQHSHLDNEVGRMGDLYFLLFVSDMNDRAHT